MPLTAGQIVLSTAARADWVLVFEAGRLVEQGRHDDLVDRGGVYAGLHASWLDATAAGEDPGPLAGLVTAHKDLTETADFTTTYGSPLFAGHRPAADCLLVARMKAAGAVAVGKTNSPEFGAGSHTFNRVYGATQNPWSLGRSAGDLCTGRTSG